VSTIFFGLEIGLVPGISCRISITGVL
jgi:hypothetical protein